MGCNAHVHLPLLVILSNGKTSFSNAVLMLPWNYFPCQNLQKLCYYLCYHLNILKMLYDLCETKLK